MTPEEYRKWRPTYSLYEKNYIPGNHSEIENTKLNQFLAVSGLATEASELQAVIHKAFRKNGPVDLAKAKDEASDVWWYFNKILDDFGWTLEELSDYNRAKLDERNKPKEEFTWKGHQKMYTY